MAAKILDWRAAVGQKVRVNLNNGLISVQLKTPGKSWFVAGHVNNAVLSCVTFHVSENGRQRVIKEKCKNVHAWAQATLLGEVYADLVTPISVNYNPHTDSGFVERHTQKPLQACQYLVVRNNQVFVSTDAIKAPATTPKLLQRKLTFFLKPHELALSLSVA